MFDIAHTQRGNTAQIDRAKDANLSPAAKALLKNKFLAPNETYQDIFGRIAVHYADDSAHAQRLYNYMSDLWFMPSEAILQNGGKADGLPVSCYQNEASDTLDDIVNLWNENVWLTSLGGRVSSYWGNIRSAGEPTGAHATASGIMPFLRVVDSINNAVSGHAAHHNKTAIFLPVWHPEIEPFINTLETQTLKRCVLITNRFMDAVDYDEEWPLKSPKDGHVIHRINARYLWDQILQHRKKHGEPALLFIDHVNDAIPEYHKMAGLNVKMADIHMGITLPTGVDHLGNERTSVCPQSFVNLEKFETWQTDKFFIEDIMRFLDNVLSDFIKKAPDKIHRAKYAAMRERSVGLGVTGFHGFLQSKMIPLESAMTKIWNRRIFEHLKHAADTASTRLAAEKGSCPDASDYGAKERFSNKIMLSPSDTESVLCGNLGTSIAPCLSNITIYQTATDPIIVKNRYLEQTLIDQNKNTDDVWQSIQNNGGSVQHLDILSDDKKEIFKISTEIEARWLITHAAERGEFICQSQSLSLHVPNNITEDDFYNLHWDAWSGGLKSLDTLLLPSIANT